MKEVANMTRIIGISGKPGSNKMFYAFRIIRELRLRGYTTDWISLAKPLYDELNHIADQVENEEGIEKIIKENNLDIRGFKLIELLNPELIGEKNPEYGYSRRNKYFRAAMSVLGTEIRREQDPEYFLKKLDEQTKNLEFAVLTDLRFPNEADYISLNHGMTIRVNVFNKENKDGGYKYNEGLNSITETSLDDYPMFDYEFYPEFFNGKDFGTELENFFKLI